MSDKSNLVSLLSILFILVVLVDTTLAAGRRDDENPSEGYKYFLCTPAGAQEIFSNHRINMYIECENGKVASCTTGGRGECLVEGDENVKGKALILLFACQPAKLEFDKFTPDGGSLKFERLRDAVGTGGLVQVKEQYEIDRATGSYSSTEQQLIDGGGWASIKYGKCEIVRKKLKY